MDRIDYARCASDAEALGENACCVPIALAVALQLPFKEVYDYLLPYRAVKNTRHGWWDQDEVAEKWGHRIRNSNPNARGWVQLAEELGLSLVEVPPMIWRGEWGVKTMVTAGRNMPKTGTFIIQTEGHVACVRNGKLEDWTKGRRHRPVRIFHVLESLIKEELV